MKISSADNSVDSYITNMFLFLFELIKKIVSRYSLQSKIRNVPWVTVQITIVNYSLLFDVITGDIISRNLMMSRVKIQTENGWLIRLHNKNFSSFVLIVPLTILYSLSEIIGKA